MMTAAIQASGLGKQYRRTWALRDCTLAIPEGHVVGLVGPNGAGKTTLLRLATGQLTSTRGTISVLGEPPAVSAAQLARVGYVAQDTPAYARMRVSDHLRLGAWLNPGWDDELAQRRIAQVGLDLKQRAGSLSGGQRAQLALTLAIAKRPELLLLDEPVAGLDPLARREFLRGLMEAVAEHGTSVVLSSHLVTDLERVCDYLIVLVASRVRSLYAASGLRTCHGGSCQNLAGSFEAQLQSTATYPALYLISVVSILLAPAVIGLFWGAPLIARELETGTSALAWNQSVTRTRWLAVKLTAVGLTAMTVTEGLSLMQAWWAAPLGRAVTHGAPAGVLYQGRFTQLIFASHGITPLGYAAFAFALGVTAGALIRRTIPAMAVTLAVFAALQVATPLWIRPHFAPADRTLIAANPGNEAGGPTGAGGGTLTLVATSLPGQFGAWILSSGPVNAAGQPVSTTPAACTAPSIENNLLDFDGCLTSQGIREAITYQPASRYWPFQWTETAIYLALALALAGYCFRQLNHRRS